MRNFAIGFSLNETIVDSADEIRSIEVIEAAHGTKARLWLLDGKAERLAARRRHMAGPTGCGLCGIESLAEALRPPLVIRKDVQYSYRQILGAMVQTPLLQRLNSETRAVHAAAFWMPEGGIVLLREDVGRHSALDKLAGALSLRLAVSVAEKAGVTLIAVARHVGFEIFTHASRIAMSD